MSEARRLSWRDIRDELSRRIAAREWQPGAAVPGEEALAAELGAARATVNRALQDLARAGIVERKRRAGTRVALHPVREARFVIPLVRQEIEAKGAAYGYRLLGCEAASAGGETRVRLGLGRRAPMLHVRCLHFADGAPYQYEDRWINLVAVPAAGKVSFDAVSPNEWNTGSTLNTLSCRPKSMRAAACAALASMLRWDSTTPLGVPSEPDVNSTAAQSPGLRATSGFLQFRRPRSLSHMVMVGRISSR